jgi:APA family basic amino acid/polyamine antiporter
VIIIAVVTYVYPWQEIVSGHVRTEVAFERTFASHRIAQLVLFAAFLSLLKIFNGNFVAATRMLYALGKREVVHPSLGVVHRVYGTPAAAIGLVALLSTVGAMLGDAILVPVTDVGSLTVGIGWLSACAAFILRRQGNESAGLAWTGVVVAIAIILMKIVPGVPGSFGRAEWIAFASWSLLGLVFWLTRRRH